MFAAKDFIETREGLIFAVVEQGTEQGRVLCFLRYVDTQEGLRKYSTEQANRLLRQSHPEYLFYSQKKDTHLHAVPVQRIIRHYRPGTILRQILRQRDCHPVQRDLQELCQLYRNNGMDIEHLGVTGSLLIGAQNDRSDIDLVVYGRSNFFQARTITRRLLESNHLQSLTDHHWRESFQRRACSLTLQEYLWHERRKVNKALINGRKFDLSLVAEHSSDNSVQYQKQGKVILRARVTDASLGYDYPAIFRIDHVLADVCVCFTATYTGQAVAGERVEIAGHLEQTVNGPARVVVGSSREAVGEYIKVIGS